jgi:hypothetical protein
VFRPALERKSLQSEAILRSSILVEHNLFGKPASTFPDHALAPAEFFFAFFALNFRRLS